MPLGLVVLEEKLFTQMHTRTGSPQSDSIMSADTCQSADIKSIHQMHLATRRGGGGRIYKSNTRHGHIPRLNNYLQMFQFTVLG